ncbi:MULTISPECIES: 7alpha-hydroxysteroid dehydrogenase [unclassified Romboutsia]|uniref:7alpha-hydroxysteroid dehydrogenase n=1 Tax=unclassified Romboutsia TaxID=2626894 RepID=UPI000820C9FE|nr:MULTISPECIES: SDR family oxidoreductase [unclassified Romboutsia]SCH87110.1 NADP-dependent 7-alpha-hydroxysteroid dehydrogenase [uncultured Clostridium sp.]
MKNLDNKVALVTSATRGIGLATALKLAKNGATVYMGVRRLEVTQEICDKYAKEGLVMKPVYFNAFEVDSYKTMVDEVINDAGKIDILVNNYGTGSPNEDFDLLNTDEKSFFRLLELNIGSVFRISKLVIPHMLDNKGGSIVNISSIGGTVPDISRIGYGVAKSGVNNITQQIAMQYAKNNIRCNAVLPGMTETDAVKNAMSKEFQKSFLSHVPLNRMGTPEDIANAVAFFASDESSYITGSILEVSGGYHLGTPQYADFVGRNVVEDK